MYCNLLKGIDTLIDPVYNVDPKLAGLEKLMLKLNTENCYVYDESVFSLPKMEEC